MEDSVTAEPAGSRSGMRLAGLGSIERVGTLGEQTYRRLWRALMTGQLAPGEKLTVRGVADAFGVSLSPAREALARLAAERALELRPNRSISVPLMRLGTYRELIKIRLLLEGHAAETAAGRITEDELDSLERVDASMTEAVERGESKRALELNQEFHFLIYRASRVPPLVSIIETLWLQVGPSLSLLTPRYQRSRRGLAHHAAAIAAARRGDAEGLRDAVQSDLRDGTKALEALLPE